MQMRVLLFWVCILFICNNAMHLDLSVLKDLLGRCATYALKTSMNYSSVPLDGSENENYLC